MYEGIYGMSCVENQVLALLRRRGEDIRTLYGGSAVPLKELFFYMVIQGQKPEFFDGVPRIQDQLKERGLLKMERHRAEDPRGAREAVRHAGPDEAVLIKVTPSFTRETLRARGFRVDHFVLAEPRQEDFVLYNDIPETTADLTSRQLSRVYAGEYFTLAFQGSLPETAPSSRRFSPESHQPFCFYEEDLHDIPEAGIRLRNMVGVYKILRYRMAAYYSLRADTACVTGRMSRVEKIYTLMEYRNLKGGLDMAPYFALLQELCQLDDGMMRQLQTELECVKK